MYRFTLLLLVVIPVQSAVSQDKAPFKWVNDFPKGKYTGLHHGTFHSASMDVDVGYCIYLPPGYDENKGKRYPTGCTVVGLAARRRVSA